MISSVPIYDILSCPKYADLFYFDTIDHRTEELNASSDMIQSLLNYGEQQYRPKIKPGDYNKIMYEFRGGRINFTTNLEMLTKLKADIIHHFDDAHDHVLTGSVARKVNNEMNSIDSESSDDVFETQNNDEEGLEV